MSSHPLTCRHAATRARRAALLAGVLATALATPAPAEPRLRCELEQGNRTLVHEVAPTADPYTVKGIDIKGRFRFKAVMLGDAGRVASVDLYTWALGPRRPVILHQAKYLAPAVQAPGAAPFTGRNFLYTPGREHELRYACTLLEVTP